MPWGLRTCDGPNADLTRSLNLSQPPMLPVWVSCVGSKRRGGWDCGVQQKPWELCHSCCGANARPEKELMCSFTKTGVTMTYISHSNEVELMERLQHSD